MTQNSKNWTIRLSPRRGVAAAREAYGAFSKTAKGRRQTAYILIYWLAYAAFVFSGSSLKVDKFITAHHAYWVMPCLWALVIAAVSIRVARDRSHFTKLRVSDEGIILSAPAEDWRYTGAIAGWTSPLIPWSAITYVGAGSSLSGMGRIRESTTNKSSIQVPSIDISISLDQISDPKSIVFQEGPFAVFGRRFRHSFGEQATISVSSAAMDDRDQNRLLSELKARIPAENIDASLCETASTSIAEGASYTTLWLHNLSTSNERLEPLAAGTIIEGPSEKIEVLDRIGSGGQSLTYRARCIDKSAAQSTIVLKEFVLPSSGGSAIFKKTLSHIAREAELLESLDHPNIVRCLGFFYSGRRAYIKLSLVQGKTLRRVIEERGAINEDAAIQYGLQMCDLLAYLHSREPAIVHRDLTPDNLMVGDDGKLVLIDFDVARRLESQQSTHTVVGKHNYMPPEQFRGQATTQSDIYALGCTLFYLLTGKDPQPISTAHAKQSGAQISNGLDELITKATAQNCAERIKDAAAFRSALKALSTISVSQPEKVT